jgi:hypothetical protein
MKTPELKAEIASLQTQFDQYSKLLDKAITDNVEFAKAREIYHELKKISDRLKKVKESPGA